MLRLDEKVSINKIYAKIYIFTRKTVIVHIFTHLHEKAELAPKFQQFIIKSLCFCLGILLGTFFNYEDYYGRLTFGMNFSSEHGKSLHSEGHFRSEMVED